MKAILEFDLEDVEDRKAHKRCINSTSLYCAIREFSNYLRNIIKHSDLSDEELAKIEVIYDKLYEELNNRGINIEEDL